MAEKWIVEFAEEIAHDSRELAEARERRAGTAWSFEVAVARTQLFYRERITGFCICGSVTPEERDHLLNLVDKIGSHD